MHHISQYRHAFREFRDSLEPRKDPYHRYSGTLMAQGTREHGTA